ncbi:MAG TPA: radical SAM protein, partial [Spirochaetia bacterium]|nr:radical SAM protein [Spirochaetia bacterium]
MIRRIALIEPRNDHLHVFSLFLLPRLGNILLATIMRDRGYDARAFLLSNQEVFERSIDADLVGISTITATAPAAYALGDHFRARGIPVVFGGPHVSFLPEEALAHGDFCIVGEGETGFPLLVEALNNGRPIGDAPGLVWKEGEALRRGPAVSPIENLDSLPFPDLDLLDIGKSRQIGLVGGGLPTIPVQTSRGCPFDCTFCSVTGMFGRRYRCRSAASVLAELARYDPKRCILFFSDDNFVANPGRTKGLLREMIRLRLGFAWTAQVRSDIARDPEMLDMMKQAGCFQLFVGFESTDPEALREMKKNQTVAEIDHAVHEIQKRKMSVHGMFIFGFDADTVETMNATMRFAIARKITTAHFLILTPFPGSTFYDRMCTEGRLLDREWETFDGQHVKFMPRGVTPWELQRT